MAKGGKAGQLGRTHQETPSRDVVFDRLSFPRPVIPTSKDHGARGVVGPAHAIHSSHTPPTFPPLPSGTWRMSKVAKEPERMRVKRGPANETKGTSRGARARLVTARTAFNSFPSRRARLDWRFSREISHLAQTGPARPPERSRPLYFPLRRAKRNSSQGRKMLRTAISDK